MAYCGRMISLFFLYDSELRARHLAISCHHGLRSGFFVSALNTCKRSPSTLAASPMIGISTWMFLLIDDGSISIWIFLEPGENASTRPVIRSSNRAPTHRLE